MIEAGNQTKRAYMGARRTAWALATSTQHGDDKRASLTSNGVALVPVKLSKGSPSVGVTAKGQGDLMGDIRC